MDMKFDDPVKEFPFQNLFKRDTEQKLIKDASELCIKSMLLYDPELRKKPLELLKQPFFDELREEGKTLPDGSPLPNLFDFKKEELNTIFEDMSTTMLVPDWYKTMMAEKELIKQEEAKDESL